MSRNAVSVDLSPKSSSSWRMVVSGLLLVLALAPAAFAAPVTPAVPAGVSVAPPAAPLTTKNPTLHPDSERPLSEHPPGAAIASGHALATEAGFVAIRAGGNAFDAAIAVSAALSVVEPISSGIGGGGFFLLHDAKSGKDIFVDARETAPESATPAAFLDRQGELDRDRSENGPWSAGIPGLPAALVHLSEKYGKLPLSMSLAPAIDLANNGFPIYERLAKGYAERADVMQRYPGTRAVYLANGQPPKVGDIFRQPDLARTLQALAKQGHDGFYKGPVAAKMLKAVKAEGGRWTADELASYQVVERAPLSFTYKDMHITTAPPPSSGGVAMQEIFQVIDGWDLAKLDPAHRTHILVEAMRRAYRDRTIYLGDPDFVKMPLDRLLSKDYAAGLRATIHPDKATPSELLSGVPAPLEDDETTHFAIIDAEGNRVSTTQTVNLLYGSGMVVPGTGVLLNNEMDDFALKPGTPNAFGVMGFAANAPVKGKRMLSSMSPSFVETPDKVMALGSPGGSTIITQVLLGILAYEDGLDPQAVAARPRIHHQWLPDAIMVEDGALDEGSIKQLEAMGHKIMRREKWGNLQTVMWNRRDDTLSGGSDPRNPVGKAEVVLTGK